MITVKLFRFSLPDEEERLYLYSIQSDEAHLRKQFQHQDSGGIPFNLYKRLYEKGGIEKITDLAQVPADPAALYRGGEQDYYPYNSWDLANEFSITVKEFLTTEDL